ncbi:MAG TPA: hypothetical protein VFZ61_03745 [Polyangiales bacterium]
MKRVAKRLGHALVMVATWLLEWGDRLLEYAGDTVPPPPSPFGPVDHSMAGQIIEYDPRQLGNRPYVPGPELANWRPLAAPLPPPRKRIPPPPPLEAYRTQMVLASRQKRQRLN